MFQQVWPMVAMVAAQQQDFKLPPTLPALGYIVKDMKPSCESHWAGPEGLYRHYQGPGIEASLTSVAGVSLGMGVLMPALARVRQLAFRMETGTNLATIGKACLLYANDHGDKLPPDLETLVKEQDLSPKCLESKTRPKNAAGPGFIYIPGQSVTTGAGNIVAYENPEYGVDGPYDLARFRRNSSPQRSGPIT
jgi:hypothetical protein